MNVARIVGAAALLLVLAAFFGSYSTRIWDTDFWWHVASGRVIVETGALPHRDPFGVYGAVSSPPAITILKGYWLMQALLYVVLEKLGTGGIIALKATLLTTCLAVLHWRATAAGAHRTVSLLVLVLAGLVLTSFTGERPQLASFVLAGVLFLLLDRHGESGRLAWLLPVPAVMLLWANCHGGVVLGAALIVLHAVATAVERWRPWSAGGARDRNAFLAVSALSLIAALASPAGWNSVLMVAELEGTDLKSRISEYASAYELWRMTGLVQFHPFAVFVGLSVLALVPLLRERRLARAAIVLVLGALGVKSFRYIPFFVLVAGPYVAAGVSALAERHLRGRPRLEPVLAALAAVAACAALVRGAAAGTMFQRGEDERFPAGAIERLQESGASGDVLTSLEWGGYVTWTTSGRLRPYVDGRNLDLNKFAKYTHMIWATPEGLRFLRDERFRYVLLPRANAFTHEEYTLNHLLRVDPRWRLVYEDARGTLFASRERT